MSVAVVGGGIVGLATARALVERGCGVVVLEAEDAIARHQTGHNSGVIHSGLYYPAGSHKARDCVAGRNLLYRYCAEHGIEHARCGKLVVAVDDAELPALAELERRGRANGLSLKRLDAAGIGRYEPQVRGVAGLWVDETGIVDYRRVARVMADELAERGVEIRTSARVVDVRREAAGWTLATPGGDVACSFVVTCAGLYSDRLARRFGVDPEVRIIPFRGEYYHVEREDLVRGLVYPVPDPRFPFLGVHFTRGIDGRVEAGPNAVPALAREGYRWRDVRPRDAAELLCYTGFWRLAGRHWQAGVGEIARSLSRGRFANALRRLVPDLADDDLTPGGSGVRAQAVDGRGRLVDDFRFAVGERSLHVVNAPSPAATAALAIGRMIAGRLADAIAA